MTPPLRGPVGSAPPKARPGYAATKLTGLLRLPLELQRHIFKLVLHEPNLWDRRHHDGCKLRPVTPKAMAQPPFMSHRVFVEAVYASRQHAPRCPRWLKCVECDPSSAALYERPTSFRLAKTWTWCTCGKRTGVNLLRANRHIFSVAAPIFWSGNTFSFFDVSEFAACIAATSPGTRDLIRGASIVTFQLQRWLDARVCLRSRDLEGHVLPEGVLTWQQKCLTALWPALKSLPKLKRLALPAHYLETAMFDRLPADERRPMRQYLALLDEMDLTNLGLCGGVTGGGHYRALANFWKRFFDGELQQTLCGFTLRIRINDRLRDFSANFPYTSRLSQWDFLTNVYDAVEAQLMVDDTDKRGRAWRRPNDDVTGGTGTATVSVSGCFRQVTLYNMPLTEDACVRNQQAQTTGPGTEKRRQNPGRYLPNSFEALRLADYRCSFKDLTDDEADRPKAPPRRKRMRVKKNRRSWKPESWKR
ncbi:hypothetical protein A9K55_008517 [Cordyceps militaris]|uniref:Uncharacterized protein n=1 Tax=Cordyceps militaris TaxID=73501 RepID=A0A2H4SE41_CORMI|nr:hypothetical protein A9K55_008517 [Cordyceps militaris]